jgi:hypothetical protein
MRKVKEELTGMVHNFIIFTEARGSKAVEALWYKPEGRDFYSR